MVTVACSDKMKERDTIISEITENLTFSFDNINSSIKPGDVSLCLNFFSNGNRLRMTKRDQVSFRVWHQLVNDSEGKDDPRMLSLNDSQRHFSSINLGSDDKQILTDR